MSIKWNIFIPNLGTTQYKVPVFKVVNVASGKYLTAGGENARLSVEDAIGDSDTQKW